VRKPNTHHFVTLENANTNTAAIDDNDNENATQLADEEEKPKAKKKSRKQKARNAKKVNLQRIDKVLAHRGVGTRSQTFELAKSKRITVASLPDAPHEERTRLKGPKEKVPYAASLFLDGNLLPGPPPLLLAYHKPKYVLSVMEDEKKYEYQNRKHLGQVLEPRFVKSGMHPVGRLDYDTTGLILFSLDGKLTQRLLHPRRGVEKEYVATVQGLVDEAVLARKLTDGVKTSEGVHKAKLIAVSPSDGPTAMDDDELEDLVGIDEGEEEEERQADYSGPYSDVRLVVSEGKYRMVRRILANCGHPVEELKRLRHGNIELGDLKVGEFREATEEEVEWAEKLMENK